ncbi:MAG: DUF192 domain-containing protein [Actinomycetota bacterium]|nr:DUF192 domain-containing protein [Actinomycetota bacterium]
MFDPERPETVVEVIEPKGVFGSVKGLLGSDEVGAGRAMLIRGRQVHTFGMRYAIDTVYLDSEGRILRVGTLSPRRVGPLVWPARSVLELDAGEAARLGLREGGSLVEKR